MRFCRLRARQSCLTRTCRLCCADGAPLASSSLSGLEQSQRARREWEEERQRHAEFIESRTTRLNELAADLARVQQRITHMSRARPRHRPEGVVAPEPDEDE